MRSGLLAEGSRKLYLSTWAEFYVWSVELRQNFAHVGGMEYYRKHFESQFWVGINEENAVQRGIIPTRALSSGVV